MDKTPILYIEDNIHNRRIVRKILSIKGYTVVEAENGIQGYEKIVEMRPPMVLLDIAIPGIDGIEVVKRVKADLELKSIPVVALTASAMRGDRERFLEAGCDDYLSKPVKAQELIEMVEKYYLPGSIPVAPVDGKEYKPKKTHEPEIQEVEVDEIAAKIKDIIVFGEIPSAIPQAFLDVYASDGSKENGGKKTSQPTVVIIDNSELETRLLRRLLTAQKIADVIEARSAEEGLSAINEAQPDIIILDLMLPDKDGEGFIEELLVEEKYSKIPIIIVTGKVLNMVSKYKLLQKVDSVWEKRGFDYNRLIEHIKQL